MSRKRLLVLFAALATALAVLAVPGGAHAVQDDADAPAVPRSASGSYIVVLGLDSSQAVRGGATIREAEPSESPAALSASHDRVLREAGVSVGTKVHDYVHTFNGFSAIMSPQEVQKVAASKDVVLILPDELHQVDTESSPEFLGLTKNNEAWGHGLTGEDVVVGVIDTGIWPEHPSFSDTETKCIDSKGKEKKPKKDGSCPNKTTATEVLAYGPSPLPPLDETAFAACDFGNVGHNADDAPFTCNNKLIGARQTLDTYRALIGAAPDEFDSARDDDGHGTHTASTAAGNAGVEAEIFGIPRGNVSGIAPRARVVAYKGLGNLGGFTSDLVAAIDQAVADGVDVINYSVGGGASLIGGDDLAYLFAADAGVWVATSAGNSGPGAGTIGGPGSVPWLTTVGASTQERTFDGDIELGNGDSYTGVSVTEGTGAVLPLVDSADVGSELCFPGLLDPVAVDGKIVLCKRGAIARVAKSDAVLQAGGAGMILYNAADTQSLNSDNHWVPSVHINNTTGLVIKDYIATAGSPEAELVAAGSGKDENAPYMAGFSSRGSNTVAEDIIKPDITAPGVQILAGNTPFPDPGSVPGELFQAIAGTSMSSPHIAGVFALVKQAHPDWSPAAAKSAIMTSAHQDVLDSDQVSAATPFGMGAGHVDPGRPGKKGSAFQPGIVYDAGFLEYLGFLCDAAPEAFTDPAATCAALDGAGIPTDASDLNLASIGIAELPGSQTVVRTVTSVADKKVSLKVKVDEPAGYDVTVVPNRLKLEPGESASYEVTITNDGSAPADEWRFGSLNWKGSGYEAYSPIAVKGALFDAPSAVEGSGTSGSASFDVTFGYDGDYTAAPHGLSGPAALTGDIGQDPDQTYPSGDDAPGPAGGVDKHPIAVAGSAFLRISLEIPGPDDIDLFLENSGGTIVAASTNGGTDELIELVLPADDTYTLVVHGWGVPNAPLSYSIDVWDVPAVPGGSLSVDSAPAAATVGTTGTVDISWTGLTAGTSYVGAVSHSDAGGIIGLTFVEVDG